jgi:squalene-hopene/tetraprenyl-beta-curcumene cyclase
LLASVVGPDGTVQSGRFGVTYPGYTAAGAVQALSRPEHVVQRPACEAWLAYQRERQLTEDLGWNADDKPYGGWGYCPHRPLKPKSGEPAHPLTESNLSATAFALEALHAAGLRAADPLFQKALAFVRRCQNYGDGPGREPAFDDGGFFLIYDDAVRNKAGIAGEGGSGRRRFASYGSATADGLRALLLCGLPAEDARVGAARAWLEQNFPVDAHPGKYAENREAHRDAV